LEEGQTYLLECTGYGDPTPSIRIETPRISDDREYAQDLRQQPVILSLISERIQILYFF
jgi:hypothetical protein